MIKLKNLWKIALATMTMSAMLVACDTGSSDNGKKNDDSGLGLTGVYSYTVNLTDIATAWGNSANSPTFSVVFLDETTLGIVKTGGDLKKNAASHPEYQIGALGNMKVADKIEEGDEGNFAVYGADPVDDVYKYYDGVAVTITDTDLTVFVDTAKLVKTQLKAMFKNEGEGDEAVMTDEHIVELAGYKPYVLALASKATDPDNNVASGFRADLMKMTEGATFPAGDLKKDAPVVPTANAINCIVGTITERWAHTPMTDNTYTFTGAADTAFAFTMGNWDYRFSDTVVTELDKEIELKEHNGGDPAHVTFADGVLTAGTEYVVTFIPKDKHKACVKVSAK